MGTIRLKMDEANVNLQENNAAEMDNSALTSQTETQQPQLIAVKYHDDAILYEDKEKRTKNAKLFILNNNTAQEIISTNPMHYFDEQEQRLRTIDNSLVENGDKFQTEYGAYRAEVAKAIGTGRTISFSKDNIGLEWTYLPKHRHGDGLCSCPQVKNKQDLSHSSDVKYENIEPDVDLQYELIGNNIKENIIVKAKQDEYRYSFKLKTNGLTMRLSEDNTNIELYSIKQNEQGETQETKEFTIPSPFMFDAKGVQSDDVYYEVELLANDEYIFHVVASSDWINEENREFPITIDPQIVTDNTSFFTRQTQYRYISSGGSGTNSSWYDVYVNNIMVSKDSAQECRTVITVKKSLMNLLNHKIISAKIKLKPYVVYQSGYIIFNGSHRHYSDGILEQDITSAFNSYTGDFTISLQPSYYPYEHCNMEFYASGANAPMLEIEYITNENTKLTKKSFSLAEFANGELNVKTGELVTGFCDVESENSLLGFNICHIHKISGDNFNAGTNFRLNLNEKLVKNTNTALDANYVYMDSNGEKHAFKDLYYYYDSNNNRVYIDRTKVAIDLDQRLIYDAGNNAIYEVFKEQRTSSGLEAITTLEGFKNVDLIEQRNDEIRQLEESSYNILNTLYDYIAIERINDNITYLQGSLNSDNKIAQFNSFLQLANEEKRYVLPKSMLSTYLSLVENLDLKQAAYDVENNKNPKDPVALTEATKAVSLAVACLNSLTDKKSYYLKYLEDLFKEYCRATFQLAQLKRQMPVNFLTDGKIIKGFNEYGDLVAIYDKYENSAVIEYEDYDLSAKGEKYRISRVYDNNGKQIVLSYNSDNLLSYIVDTRGRKTKYKYNSGKLSEVTFANGKTMTIVYDSKNNIVLIESSDNMRTSLMYSGSQLTSLTNNSLASKISHGSISLDTLPLQLSRLDLEYQSAKTIIRGKDSNGNSTNDNEYFEFNSVGNLAKYFVEKQGKVVRAERYDYKAYISDKTEYAQKSKLNVAAYSSSFDFGTVDYEFAELDKFNNPISSTRYNYLASNNFTKVTTAYTYDDDHKCEMARSTVLTTTPSGSRTNHTVTKTNYNSSGNVVRTESYVEGEELLCGKNIEEFFYDERGNQTKSVSYNSLDASSKFYSESEYAENGQALAEIDETGENKTELSYIDGTNIVSGQRLPNGSKLAYGRDFDDTVTAISQSTECGEENSTQSQYTSGVVTELRSGNNIVNYEYDHKRRVTKVGLNGNDSYITNAYFENVYKTNVNGQNIMTDKVETKNTKDEKFTTYVDKSGNLIGYDVEDFAQILTVFDNKNRLIKERVLIKDETYGVSAKYDTLDYTYDSLDKLDTVKRGAAVIEDYNYDSYGNLSAKMLKDGVDHAYSYTYKNDSARMLEKISIKDLTITPNRDILNRKSGKVVSLDGENLAGEYCYYSKYGDHATSRISSIRYGDKSGGVFAIREGLKYAYDSMGNISRVYENGQLQTSYTYDKLNRLLREDNKSLNKTFIFNYDNNGNITGRIESTYTAKPLEEIESQTAYNYTYECGSDRLLGYNGESFAYDVIGNPTTYRGKSVTWAKGRQMTNFNGTAITYNGRGQRTQKGSITYTYDASGNLIKQSDGLEFIYDDSGVCGFMSGGSSYIYRKNAQGDVIAIANTSGIVVAKYTYDAWGNHKVLNPNASENTTSTFIGNVNPIRYRSYYFDTDIKLYYLKTRYYDPQIGRFVTIDDVSYIDPESINGLNLYAYCGDNPVMHTDSTGTMPDWLRWMLGIVIIVGAVALSIVTAGLAAPIAAGVGGGLFGAIVGGAVAGAIGGAIAGFGISVGMQGISNGFDNINWSEVGKATLSGAISGFVAGGVFGSIKHIADAAKIAKSISGLGVAQANMDKAALALKSTDSFVGVYKGGSMAIRTIAQNGYQVAQRALSAAEGLNAFANFAIKNLYRLGQFGLKQLIGYGVNQWL